MKKEEMETIVRFDPVDDTWYAWTNISKHINDLKKKGWLPIEEADDSCKFKAPPHAVRFCKAEKPNKRSISEEQRKAMRKRLAEAREHKNIDKNI